MKTRTGIRLIGGGILTKEKVDFCYKSWGAYAKKGDSRGQLLKMDKYYLSLWE